MVVSGNELYFIAACVKCIVRMMIWNQCVPSSSCYLWCPKTCHVESESVNLKMLPPKNKPRGGDWYRAIFSKDVVMHK